MKIYTIKLHFPETTFTMCWYFTSLKEAILYGEYQYREFYDLIDYEIEKHTKCDPFYKLK